MKSKTIQNVDESEPQRNLFSTSTLIEIGFFYWLIDFQMINQKKIVYFFLFFSFVFMIIRHE